MYALTQDHLRWSEISLLEVDDVAVDLRIVQDDLIAVTESEVHFLSFDDSKLKLNNSVAIPDGPISNARLLNVGGVDSSALVLLSKADQPPQVFDYKLNKIIWSGKNGPDTPLGLKATFDIQAMAWLSPTVFAAGDTTGKLRFYDISQQRKPMIEMPVFELFNVTNHYTGTSGMGQTRPLKRLELSKDGLTLFVGDTYGCVLALDLSKPRDNNGLVKLPQSDTKIGTAAHRDFCRKLIPMQYCLSGIMGSVRDIAVTDSKIFVVSAGRYAYCFDIKSKGKKFDKMFMKQKLTYCLPIESAVVAEPSPDKADSADSEADEQEIDEVVGMLDAQADQEPMTKSKRRRLRKGASSKPH
jgi:hypothetical protein